MSHDNPNDRYSWARDIEATTEQREATQRSGLKSKAVIAMCATGLTAVAAMIVPDEYAKYAFLIIGFAIVSRMALINDGADIKL